MKSDKQEMSFEEVANEIESRIWQGARLVSDLAGQAKEVLEKKPVALLAVTAAFGVLTGFLLGRLGSGSRSTTHVVGADAGENGTRGRARVV